MILSLFDYSGNMVRPWVEAGYECAIVDIQHPSGVYKSDGLWKIGADMNDWEPEGLDIEMAFAFPPCTHLAGSGARWWKEKGEGALIEALTLVQRAWSVMRHFSRGPYMLENPVGRLSTLWSKPDFYFHPFEYGGYLPGGGDHYTKKTCLWVGNGFKMPAKKAVLPSLKSYIHRLPPSKDRAMLRSITPMGFAYAVYEANRGWNEHR